MTTGVRFHDIMRKMCCNFPFTGSSHHTHTRHGSCCDFVVGYRLEKNLVLTYNPKSQPYSIFSRESESTVNILSSSQFFGGWVDRKSHTTTPRLESVGLFHTTLVGETSWRRPRITQILIHTNRQRETYTQGTKHFPKSMSKNGFSPYTGGYGGIGGGGGVGAGGVYESSTTVPHHHNTGTTGSSGMTIRRRVVDGSDTTGSSALGGGYGFPDSSQQNRSNLKSSTNAAVIQKLDFMFPKVDTEYVVRTEGVDSPHYWLVYSLVS